MHFYCDFFLHLSRMNSFINQKFSTMNTKRVIFGILAVVMLATTAVSTITIDDQDTGVDKRKIRVPKSK